MSDKRGTWSKEDRDTIWRDYIENKMWKMFTNLNELNWDWTQEAPCSNPYCGRRMLKAQYQGAQPDMDFSWDIDHIDSNPNNNNLNNLQPMHPWCNKSKG